MIDYVFRSIRLDINFFRLPINRHTKITFFLKKYWHILLFLIGIEKENQILCSKIFGTYYHYDNPFGLGFLQSTFVDNAFLKSFINPRSIIIDVGANTGQFNLFVKFYLNARQIYSYEPQEKTFQILKKNKFRANRLAISNKKGTAYLFSSNLSLTASLLKSDNSFKQEKVKTNTLDNLMTSEKINTISLLKIDVEGSEFKVLLGATKTLSKTNYAIVETSLNRLKNHRFSELVDLMSKRGFEIIDMGRVYKNNNIAESVDLLFINKNFH